MTQVQVSMIGTGYVGLTNAVALAYLGHHVTCVDVDAAKIAQLKTGKLPIFEPNLEELARSVTSHLTFTTDYAEAVPKADVVFIAVGTPTGTDGAPDLRYLQAAARAVGENLGDKFTVIVNKSTVPIGSANWVETLVRDAFEAKGGATAARRFAVASNPEFLREGSALFDTFYADRTVIGADDIRAIHTLTDLYRPITEQTFAPPTALPRPEALSAVPLITTDLASAELIKYSANAFLSLKLSFINEIAELAERVGADILQVAKGIGSDERIGNRFLQAGIGWGGSCFGKDTAALVSTGGEYGLNMPIVRAAREVNWRQRERVIEKLLAELKILKGRTIGILGLAFKPFTDDLRDAPALQIARSLLERGAKVKVHDPVAMTRSRAEAGLALDYCDAPGDVAVGADALVLATEWPEYQRAPWTEMARSMRTAILLDGRNALQRDVIERAGFRYIGMGR
jgi:UDPglucose 6-dehydrogenase